MMTSNEMRESTFQLFGEEQAMQIMMRDPNTFPSHCAETSNRTSGAQDEPARVSLSLYNVIN